MNIPQTNLALKHKSTSPQAKKLLMMVPDDFMWPEYAQPRETYEKAGVEVVVATKDGELARPDARNYGKFEDVAPVDGALSFSEVNVEDFDAVTTVGGNGAWKDFMPNPEAHRVLGDSLKMGKVTGLICASTGVLAVLDNFDGEDEPLVKGRTVTGYYKVEAMLREMGEVDFVEGGPKDVTVAVDGNLVTGRNPESSTRFGEEVLRVLGSNPRT